MDAFGGNNLRLVILVHDSGFDSFLLLKYIVIHHEGWKSFSLTWANFDERQRKFNIQIY